SGLLGSSQTGASSTDVVSSVWSKPNSLSQLICVRGSGGPHIEPQYRQYPQLTKKQQFDAELLSGAMWFWILWHCWHDPDAVTGHFPWPDPAAWTDEELGIPPDDEE
uniref:NADH dehydrogenase [ubiquinone] 1 beta subcomplex subunit 2, mitochondrial n=1 Tax=Myripristis murdjan TaxID=586833 RepID=A0A668A929_9TELE